MTEISFFTGEAALALLWLMARAVFWLCRRRIEWRREAQLLIMLINLAVIIRFTFYPFYRVDGRVQPLVFDPAAVLPLRVNLTPIAHILYFATKRELYINLVGNVAMFIPSGIVLPALYERLDRFGKVLLAGAGISLCVELCQLPFGARATDVDDFLLNTLGVAVGYGIYMMVRGLKRRNKWKHTAEG